MYKHLKKSLFLVGIISLSNLIGPVFAMDNDESSEDSIEVIDRRVVNLPQREERNRGRRNVVRHHQPVEQELGVRPAIRRQQQRTGWVEVIRNNASTIRNVSLGIEIVAGIANVPYVPQFFNKVRLVASSISAGANIYDGNVLGGCIELLTVGHGVRQNLNTMDQTGNVSTELRGNATFNILSENENINTNVNGSVEFISSTNNNN